MSSEEKYFSDFSQTWPKGGAKPVMGERGNHDLPSGTEGGEKMDLDLHYEHKQNRFVSLSELPEDASEQLAVYDFYPWEYTAFPVDGDVILIKDDRLAEALTALPQEFRDILLMYWFLQMADREIGEKLSLPRKTVNNRRQRAYELLKKLMGGDEDA